MSKKPLPCPQCGQEPQGNNWHTFGANPSDETRYFCVNPDCPDYCKAALSLAVWNCRVYPPSVQAVLDAAKVIGKELSTVYMTWTGWKKPVDAHEYYAVSDKHLRELLDALRALKEEEKKP